MGPGAGGGVRVNVIVVVPSYVAEAEINVSYEAQIGARAGGTGIMLLGGLFPFHCWWTPFCSSFCLFYTFWQECLKVALNHVYTCQEGPSQPGNNSGITENNCSGMSS